MSTATSSCRSGSTPDERPPAFAARRLRLADVRCWTRGDVRLPEGLTVVSGPNGAGKTSLVEAIVLGCLGVSPRTSREAEIVRRGAEALHVDLELHGPEGTRRREIGYAPGVGRRLRLDDAPVRGLARWRVAGAVLVFVPEERGGKRRYRVKGTVATGALFEAGESGCPISDVPTGTFEFWTVRNH